MKTTAWLMISLVSSSLCAAPSLQRSFSWWMLPENNFELPHEIEEDDSQSWTEMWYRPDGDTLSQPTMVMEQGVGVRWAGMEFDSQGVPGQAYLVFGDSKIVNLTKDKTRWGNVSPDGAKITWSDGTTQDVVDFKKRHRRGRRSRGQKTKMRFGKITLPAAMGTLQADLSTWSVEGLERFLEVVKEGPVEIPVRAFGGISGLEDQNGSLLGFRYGDSCKFETRTEIENLVARYIEPKLTCAASQDKDLAQRLFAVFLQRPVLECKSVKPMTNAQCGMATLPVSGPFFLGRPKIAIDMRESCREGMSDLILHEIFHLVGARDNPSQQMDKYVELSESCSESSASLTFDNGERSEFLNSSQVETRMLLFRRVRDDAVSKWGWQSSEKDLVLGTICSHMGDRSCSRKFFEQAATGQLSGTVALPEGDTVSLSALAQYLFFDETTEDTFRMRNRMRELTKYLRRDPQGMLLKRNEYSGTRLHEYFVVRAALEKVKGNKNICDDNTDDRIYCEDLSAISQTPWFRNQ